MGVHLWFDVLKIYASSSVVGLSKDAVLVCRGVSAIRSSSVLWPIFVAKFTDILECSQGQLPFFFSNQASHFRYPRVEEQLLLRPYLSSKAK